MNEPVTGAFFLDLVDSDQSQTDGARARTSRTAAKGRRRGPSKGLTPPRGR